MLATGLGLAGAMVLPSVPSADASAAPRQQPKPGSSAGMYVVLLGTGGGPAPHVDRAGIASVVVVDGANYLVDAGRAAVTQYTRAGLQFRDLTAMFVTHLHADHVADYFNFFLLGGVYLPNQGDTLTGPIPVFGPGPAGGLPPTYGGGTSPTTNPADPTPGLTGLTDYCAGAFAYSTNVFMRDSLIRETRSLAEVREIELPDIAADYENRAPTMQPFVVMEDDRVRVSAVLVPHGPVFPSFAYRFESDHGTITLSGDTTYSDNIVTLADHSDVLVHEAINIVGWAGSGAVKNHMLESHVEVQKVGPIAEAANVRHLVLSHIGDLASDVINVGRWHHWAQNGFSGRVDVGADLASYGVGTRA
ncbi:MAG TPA: MBL fold metallo-hydrolase [Amycolatopsis sp.]|nr:MBL fold metallo-hydrolase [Amycolatopsis sp.]